MRVVLKQGEADIGEFAPQRHEGGRAAETAVRESKDRVRGAILSCKFKFPQERITVSLGPADMRKTGGRFDLAIALGILAAG